MAEINWVRVIADQDCTGNLERKHAKLNKWVDADGHSFSVSMLDGEQLVDALVLSAVAQTDAAIMRMMR